MSVKGDLLLVGNLNVDLIYEVDELPAAGVSTPVRGFRRSYGGCGGNIGYAAAMLGIDVHLSSVVGEDLSPGYRSRLEEVGVDLSHLVVDPELPSPYCLVLSSRNEEQAYAFMMGAMERQTLCEVPEGEYPFCHLATSDPSFCRRVSESMRKRGAQVALDPGQEIFFRWSAEDLAGTLKNCSRFFSNLGEWEHLGKVMGWEKETIDLGGMNIPTYREAFSLVEEAVVTLGRYGSALIRKDDILQVPAVDVKKIKDPTGAGDAFRGGYYAGSKYGLEGADILRTANAMGAIAIQAEGPQGYYTTMDEVERIAKGL